MQPDVETEKMIILFKINLKIEKNERILESWNQLFTEKNTNKLVRAQYYMIENNSSNPAQRL
jgi:hypothetical protein